MPRASRGEWLAIVDSSDVGIEAALYAIVGVVVGILLAGVVVAMAASLLGRRRFGLLSIGMGLVVAIATVVDVVVIWRFVGGEATGWDLLWAAGLTVAGGGSLHRLAAPPHPSADAR
jgi:hypothetical protein